MIDSENVSLHYKKTNNCCNYSYVYMYIIDYMYIYKIGILIANHKLIVA